MSLVIIILSLILFYLILRLCQSREIEGFSSGRETIFVSIPSYRDIDCKNTLRSIFEKARYPELVYVGVFEQNDSSYPDESCSVDDKWRKNVRYKYVHYEEAKVLFMLEQ